MMRYEIAGLQIDLEAGGRTLSQAAPYAVPATGEPDMVIRCNLARVMEHNPQFQDPDLAEYVATGARFAGALLDHHGFMLHSSAIILHGKAYLFSAPSGMGKSTHTEKWIRLFGAKYLNDDKPALRLVDGTWMAYGTPWSGKHDLSSPQGVPLGGIALICRGQENTISRIPTANAIHLLMSQTVYKLPKEKMEVLLTLLDHLLRDIPVWKLECLNNDEAAFVARNAMCKEPHAAC